ncbi:GtrA family protein [Rhizobium panacihumi]|uniref:GtrA family protein n=1 Tax=Rhizobium panacihumi TaxID=2008450 RepID=UPI003D796296
MKIFSTEFMRYVVVGGATAFIYFGLVLVFVEIFGLHGVVPVSMAYITSVVFHFFSSKLFTFRTVKGNVSGQVARYLTVVALNYLVTAVTVYCLVDYLRYPTYVGAGLAIAATLVIGYGMTKFWVFQRGGIRRG